MNRAWRWALPCYVLMLPSALIGVLYALTWCRATSWRWCDGVLTFVARRPMIGNPGGQGWSWVVGFASEDARGYAPLRVHEFVHVVQEFVCAIVGAIGLGAAVSIAEDPRIGVMAGLAGGGALFAILYIGTFLAAFLRAPGAGWVPAYMRIPFEVHAYRVEAEYDAGRRRGAWGSKPV